MKTVVTGGAGFIGSNLVRKLLNQGREVIIVDDFSRGKKINLYDLGIRTDCLSIDLKDFAQTSEILKNVETVFHLAARIGGINYLHGSNRNELEAVQTNLFIDANVFKACLEHHVSKLVYSSSVSVYPIDLQQSSNVTFSENILHYFEPDGGYGWAKLLGEIQLDLMENIDIGIARIFNIYGENSVLSGSSHVIVDLIRKAIQYPEQKFVVWGDGKQSRDFLYVSDCVDALLQLEKEASNPPIIVNVGSGKEVSIGTIAEKITGISGKDIKIEYDTRQPVGPLSRTADITKARAVLNWQPKVSLDDGIRRTYLWVQKRLEEEEASGAG
ncbi:NAD-dependent epimerase/dehydratase family protein [Chloroflexota bacterium]